MHNSMAQLEALVQAVDKFCAGVDFNARAQRMLTPQQAEQSEARAAQLYAAALARCKAEVTAKAGARLPKVQAMAAQCVGRSIKVALGVSNLMQVGTVAKCEARYRVQHSGNTVKAVFYYEVVVATKDGRKVCKSLKPF